MMICHLKVNLKVEKLLSQTLKIFDLTGIKSKSILIEILILFQQRNGKPKNREKIL